MIEYYITRHEHEFKISSILSQTAVFYNINIVIIIVMTYLIYSVRLLLLK